MKILAIDLAKNKSVFVDYAVGGVREFGKVSTDAGELEALLRQRSPDRLVIEACPSAGWVSDLAQSLKIPIQVANGNDERWRWKVVKEKSDRKDALKLAQLSEMESLPTVHVPRPQVRQWRSLIEYRHGLVDRRTAIKNSIRAIYERQGVRLGSGGKAWSEPALEELKKEASGASADQWWLLQVRCELEQFENLRRRIEEVEAKLEEIAAGHALVKGLRTAPCVGPRLSEAVVAILDDPRRFKNARQVGCYAGLTPRRWQSGESDRQGHISKAGNALLRKLLVEIAWMGVRNKTWMLEVYERVRRGSDQRKKIAIVAVARRLLVRLWAMMRDGTTWQEPRADLAAEASEGILTGALPPIPQDLALCPPPTEGAKKDGPGSDGRPKARPVSRMAIRGGAPVASQQSRILRADKPIIRRGKKARKVLSR